MADKKKKKGFLDRITDPVGDAASWLFEDRGESPLDKRSAAAEEYRRLNFPETYTAQGGVNQDFFDKLAHAKLSAGVYKGRHTSPPSNMPDWKSIVANLTPQQHQQLSQGQPLSPVPQFGGASRSSGPVPPDSKDFVAAQNVGEVPRDQRASQSEQAKKFQEHVKNAAGTDASKAKGLPDRQTAYDQYWFSNLSTGAMEAPFKTAQNTDIAIQRAATLAIESLGKDIDPVLIEVYRANLKGELARRVAEIHQTENRSVTLTDVYSFLGDYLVALNEQSGGTAAATKGT